jgi:hypothetical protein
MISKIFSPEKIGEKMALYVRSTASFILKIWSIVFEKNAKFFAENRRKSAKHESITSTPGWEIFNAQANSCMVEKKL